MDSFIIAFLLCQLSVRTNVFKLGNCFSINQNRNGLPACLLDIDIPPPAQFKEREVWISTIQAEPSVAIKKQAKKTELRVVLCFNI